MSTVGPTLSVSERCGYQPCPVDASNEPGEIAKYLNWIEELRRSRLAVALGDVTDAARSTATDRLSYQLLIIPDDG